MSTDYITTAEAAKLLNVSQRTIQRWVKEHQFTDILIAGKTMLIPRRQVEQLLKKHGK